MVLVGQAERSFGEGNGFGSIEVRSSAHQGNRIAIGLTSSGKQVISRMTRRVSEGGIFFDEIVAEGASAHV